MIAVVDTELGKKTNMASKTKKLRKRYQTVGNRGSVQSSLIARAEQIALRKGIMFVGETAEWLRNVADGTAQRIFEPIGQGIAANDETVLREIDRAMGIFKTIVENAARQVNDAVRLTVELLREVLEAISPAPPVTD
ncbi:MAG: hypothetical protein AAGI03_00380 [Pseudomonadota bacterium]